MKKYEITIDKDSDIFKESLDKLSKDELKESTVAIVNIHTAQEAIIEGIKMILKKKNMNPAVCMNLIGEAFITGIDSTDEIFPNSTNEEQLQAKARVIAKRLARYILEYSKNN